MLPTFCRFSTKVAQTRAALHRQLASHYISQGDSPAQSSGLASQELRWLEQGSKKLAKLSGEQWRPLLRGMVHQLVAENKPLAYILGSPSPLFSSLSTTKLTRLRRAGTQPFHPLPVSLLVRPPTLIPRPETEHWLLHLASLFLPSSSSPTTKPRLNILDIGTGTGCIPLSLAYSLSPHYALQALGVDLSPAAVQLAKDNVQQCRLRECVHIVQGDLFQEGFVEEVWREGGGAFDLVVSNPPYITRRDYESLAPSVRDWEDRRALVGEQGGGGGVDDGLVFYDRIVRLLPALLGEGGRGQGGERPVVALEVGMGQAQEVSRKVKEAGFRSEVVKDQWDIERLVLGYRT